MIDRLRALAEDPFDPEVLRSVIAIAGAVLIGFGALLVLALGLPDTEGESRGGSVPLGATVWVAPRNSGNRPSDRPGMHRGRRQDPQDIAGSPAARRAYRALRSLRALQHVPYRRGGLAIDLVGARGSRAVLRVSAPTISAARRGWRRFLRRCRDSGRAYVPVFEALGGSDG